ncbi:MAG: tetraacyldisaccharide 4'-kinase, partial [Phycisphaerales bacterium]
MLLGRPLEPIYRAIIRRRNRSFDAGRGVTRFGVPVVSVGNLSVGGTGKSPMVTHIVASLLRAGLRPCIAMRGYSKSRGQTSRHHAPDETDAYLRTFPQVPVIARPDRAAGI